MSFAILYATTLTVSGIGLTTLFFSIGLLVVLIIGELSSLREEIGYHSFCADGALFLVTLFFALILYGIYIETIADKAEFESHLYYNAFCIMFWILVWLWKRTYTVRLLKKSLLKKRRQTAITINKEEVLPSPTKERARNDRGAILFSCVFIGILFVFGLIVFATTHTPAN